MHLLMLLDALKLIDTTICAHSQDGQERTQAEQTLAVFGQSTEYIIHCKVEWLRDFPSFMFHAATHFLGRMCTQIA
jgi:hypothetical protein